MNLGPYETVVHYEPGKTDQPELRDYMNRTGRLTWQLRGHHGTVTFVLMPGWYTPDDERQLRQALGPMQNTMPAAPNIPFPIDLGIHWKTPLYKDDQAKPRDVTGQDNCQYLDDSPCYYDGTGLGAMDMFAAMTRKGNEGIWPGLVNRYEGTLDSTGLTEPEKKRRKRPGRFVRGTSVMVDKDLPQAGCILFFALFGRHGIISYAIHTGWMPIFEPPPPNAGHLMVIMPGDIKPTPPRPQPPTYGWKKRRNASDIFGCGTGTFRNALPTNGEAEFNILLRFGSDGLWAHMEGLYEAVKQKRITVV